MIVIYDKLKGRKKPFTLGRYTAINLKKPTTVKGQYEGLSFSSNPLMKGGVFRCILVFPGVYLGKIVQLGALTKACQKAVKKAWEIE